MNPLQPTITATLAAGSVASPFLLDVNITQPLCEAVCAEAPVIFTPTISVVEWAAVADGLYMVTLRAEGLISYTPCTGGVCCTRSQLCEGAFTLPVYAAKAPTAITITQGTTINAATADPCRRCTRLLVSETPITLTLA